MRVPLLTSKLTGQSFMMPAGSKVNKVPDSPAYAGEVLHGTGSGGDNSAEELIQFGIAITLSIDRADYTSGLFNCAATQTGRRRLRLGMPSGGSADIAIVQTDRSASHGGNLSLASSFLLVRRPT
jgi:hypothetical protein